MFRRLHAERIKLHFPWTISPFVKEHAKPIEGDSDEEEEIEDEKGTPVTQEIRSGLRVKTANEVPWIDLVIRMLSSLSALTVLRFWKLL